MNNPNKRLGTQTVLLPSTPSILGIGTVAGKKETEGPLGIYFDVAMADSLENNASWELEERNMLETAVNTVLKKTNTLERDIHYILMGDLLNQIISASYTARDLAIPFIGLYGACSTMALSISVASMLIDGGFAEKAVAATCSHFCTAERQYRYPLEMGVQRMASSQWTATGAGAVLLSEHVEGTPSITCLTTGRVTDYQIEDVNNMGAAMAPAAANTLKTHLLETGRMPNYYDLILTGDLGKYGREIVLRLLCDEYPHLCDNYKDCGCELFGNDKSVKAGASGCGCSALYMAKVLSDMKSGVLKRVLFMSTGALHNPTILFQKESIPCIAHAVAIEML